MRLVTGSEQIQDFLAALDSSTATCVDSSTLTRALYSSDASLYRVVPQAVATPRDRCEVDALLAAARAVDLPVTARGAGTSCAGNAVGAGLVVDLRRHINHIHSIDPEARTADVDPGVVQENLQRAAQPHRLRFGPDPSTSARCTIGGIVSNNACGPRALGYGIAATNLVDADIITGTGDSIRLTELAKDPDHPVMKELSRLVDENLGFIRTQFGRFSRQVSGYSLEHLLPEKGRDVVKFFAGSEGTLGLATRLTVRLVEDPARTATLALGYPSMADAADAVPALLRFRPTAVEGMDSRIVEVVRRAKGDQAVPDLPRGDGWMFVELGGSDPGELASRGAELIANVGALEGWIVSDPAQAARLWKIRSDGAGLAGVSLAKPAYAGWEDAAVPPDQLGAYLRQFEELVDTYGFHTLPYGHFGEGCVHARIDFPLTEPGGLPRYRSFVMDAARLVAGFGGSISGEHGDGRARSDLLPLMYTPEAIALFNAVKHIFDPEALLNPGVIADPEPLDKNVRYSALADNPLARAHPNFSAQVHRCTGVGSCVAPHPTGVMCPSYQATHEEKDSTRGRAHILQEMVNGTLVNGWDSPEVAQALDLCLACKGCATDCPTAVDIASAKSYVLHQRYRGHVRPRSHYSLGWLPRWGRLVTRLHIGPAANAVLRLPGIGRLGKAVASVDHRRPLPRFSSVSARSAMSQVQKTTHHDPQTAGTPARTRKPVLVWVDSFTDCFEGTALPALVKVLVHSGYAPQFLERTACCGLTWITTGQRDGAARQIHAALDQLAPIAAQGIPIVAMEPSCLAVWRSDAAELVDDPRVALVARSILTLAELLTRDESWTPPDLSGHQILAQPHCHHSSVLGFDTDAALLKRGHADLVILTGCCGLAGNFGVEIGHYDTSVAVAETHLLPALRAHPTALVLADGFSCRKQVSDLTDRTTMTLAELLAAHLPTTVTAK
ncbi:MAG: FAD-binding oxidoreductase [Propionibacteriaceae bacterium]|nr:FAD-binding oxidoreductase [Propionibacteriaceae bacterium]